VAVFNQGGAFQPVRVNDSSSALTPSLIAEDQVSLWPETTVTFSSHSRHANLTLPLQFQ
jgi:hypothetical protein